MRTRSAPSAMAAGADRIAVGQRRIGRRWNFVGESEIAMAARLRNHRAGRPNARARGNARVDRALQPEGRAGHVANAGESAHQRLFGLDRRHQVEVADVRGHQHVQRRRRHHGVPVGVDEPRHQHPAAAVDDPHIGVERPFSGPDGLDDIAFDHNAEATSQRIRLAVEHPDVGEGDGRVGRGRCAGGGAPRSGGERAERRACAGAGRELFSQTPVQSRKGRGMAEAGRGPRPALVVRRAREHFDPPNAPPSAAVDIKLWRHREGVAIVRKA